MLRYVLVLVLAAPLGYTAYNQGYALFGFDKPAALREAALEAPDATLKDVRESVSKRGKPADDVQQAVLSVAGKCPDLRPDSKQADVVLVEPLKAHANN